MLIEKDGTGRGRTVFKCDRCNKYLTRDNRYGLYIQQYKFSPKKAYDLCDKCFKALKRGIELKNK